MLEELQWPTLHIKYISLHLSKYYCPQESKWQSKYGGLLASLINAPSKGDADHVFHFLSVLYKDKENSKASGI